MEVDPQRLAGLVASFLSDQSELLKQQAHRLNHFVSTGVILAPSSSSSDSKIDPKKGQKKVKPPVDPNAPKKPTSAYLLFMAENTGPYKAANPSLSQKEVMTNVAKKWSEEISAATKEKYVKQAAQLKNQYTRELESYKSQKDGGLRNDDEDDDDDDDSDDDDEEEEPIAKSKSQKPAAKQPVKPVVAQSPVKQVVTKGPAAKVAVGTKNAAPAPASIPVKAKAVEDAEADKKKKRRHEEQTVPVEASVEDDGEEKKKKKKKKKSKDE